MSDAGERHYPTYGVNVMNTRTMVVPDCITEEHLEGHYYGVSVEWRGKGRWALVNYMGEVWSKTQKKWDYEMRPSSRTERWLKSHRYDDYDEALTAAMKIATKHKVLGNMTAEEYVKWFADQSEEK